MRDESFVSVSEEVVESASNLTISDSVVIGGVIVASTGPEYTLVSDCDELLKLFTLSGALTSSANRTLLNAYYLLQSTPMVLARTLNTRLRAGLILIGYLEEEVGTTRVFLGTSQDCELVEVYFNEKGTPIKYKTETLSFTFPTLSYNSSLWASWVWVFNDLLLYHGDYPSLENWGLFTFVECNSISDIISALSTLGDIYIEEIETDGTSQSASLSFVCYTLSNYALNYSEVSSDVSTLPATRSLSVELSFVVDVDEDFAGTTITSADLTLADYITSYRTSFIYFDGILFYFDEDADLSDIIAGKTSNQSNASSISVDDVTTTVLVTSYQDIIDYINENISGVYVTDASISGFFQNKGNIYEFDVTVNVSIVDAEERTIVIWYLIEDQEYFSYRQIATVTLDFDLSELVTYTELYSLSDSAEELVYFIPDYVENAYNTIITTETVTKTVTTTYTETVVVTPETTETVVVEATKSIDYYIITNSKSLSDLNDEWTFILLDNTLFYNPTITIIPDAHDVTFYWAVDDEMITSINAYSYIIFNSTHFSRCFYYTEANLSELTAFLTKEGLVTDDTVYVYIGEEHDSGLNIGTLEDYISENLSDYLTVSFSEFYFSGSDYNHAYVDMQVSFYMDDTLVLYYSTSADEYSDYMDITINSTVETEESFNWDDFNDLELSYDTAVQVTSVDDIVSYINENIEDYSISASSEVEYSAVGSYYNASSSFDITTSVASTITIYSGIIGVDEVVYTSDISTATFSSDEVTTSENVSCTKTTNFRCILNSKSLEDINGQSFFIVNDTLLYFSDDYLDTITSISGISSLYSSTLLISSLNDLADYVEENCEGYSLDYEESVYLSVGSTGLYVAIASCYITSTVAGTFNLYSSVLSYSSSGGDYVPTYTLSTLTFSESDITTTSTIECTKTITFLITLNSENIADIYQNTFLIINGYLFSFNENSDTSIVTEDQGFDFDLAILVDSLDGVCEYINSNLDGYTISYEVSSYSSVGAFYNATVSLEVTSTVSGRFAVEYIIVDSGGNSNLLYETSEVTFSEDEVTTTVTTEAVTEEVTKTKEEEVEVEQEVEMEVSRYQIQLDPISTNLSRLTIKSNPDDSIVGDYYNFSFLTSSDEYIGKLDYSGFGFSIKVVNEDASYYGNIGSTSLSSYFGSNSLYSNSSSDCYLYISAAMADLERHEEYNIEGLCMLGLEEHSEGKLLINLFADRGTSNKWFTPIGVPRIYLDRRSIYTWAKNLGLVDKTPMPGVMLLGPFDKVTDIIPRPVYIDPGCKYWERVSINKAYKNEFAPVFWKETGAMNMSNPCLELSKQDRDVLLNRPYPINWICQDQKTEDYYLNQNWVWQRKTGIITEEEQITRQVWKISRDLDPLLRVMFAKQNNKTTRTRAVTLVEEYLTSCIMSQNFAPVEYNIVCDTSNNTDEVINAHILNFLLEVRYQGSIKWIAVINRAYPQDADFTNEM